jgi:hypothetical protein
VPKLKHGLKQSASKDKSKLVPKLKHGCIFQFFSVVDVVVENFDESIFRVHGSTTLSVFRVRHCSVNDSLGTCTNDFELGFLNVRN